MPDTSLPGAPAVIRPRPFLRDFGPFAEAEAFGGSSGAVLAIERFSAQPDALSVANPSLRLCRHLGDPVTVMAGPRAGRRMFIARGQHFVFGPGAEERFRWDSGFRTLSLTVTETLLRGLELPTPRLGAAVRAEDPILDRLTALALIEIEQGFPRGELFAEGLALAAAAHLAACGRDGLPLHPGTRGALTRQQLERLREAVEHALPERPSLALLAAAAGVPAQRLGAAFRAATGTSLWNYVANRRVALAERWLRDPAIPLSSVALRAGYSSQAHMTTAFRQLRGLTPAAWRRYHFR